MTTDVLVDIEDAISLDELEQPSPERTIDTPPKKRGRPIGSKNQNARTPISRQPGASGRLPRVGSKAWLAQQCAMLVGAGNILLTLSPFRADALDEREMTLLADALAAEAMSSERVLRWLTAAAGISPHFLLIQACVTIAIPRLARRGVLPRAAVRTNPDAGINPQSDIPSENTGFEYPSVTPFPVEARGTPYADR